MKPTKEQMHQWYVVEKKSYRQIMNLIGTKNNRKVRQLLEQYNIPIRRGSEAVKTQWISNDERRKQQAKYLSEKLKGKPSKRRIPTKELAIRYAKKGLIIHDRKIIDGYTVLDCECKKCGYSFKRTLKNWKKGCFKCAVQKTTDAQKNPFEVVQGLFDVMGLVLLTTEYENGKSKLEFICPKHSIQGVMTTTYSKLRQRHGEGRRGCRYCTYDSMRNEELHEARKSWMYREWREAVFKRDNYTCQCCGDNKGGNLQAHHIENFAENEQERFDINNGITLCEPCHNPSIEGSFHYVYGTRDNNREQLEEYIQNKQLALL